GVVQLFAYDSPQPGPELALVPDNIFQNYQPQSLNPAEEENNPDNENNGIQFHRREYRRTVIEYIPESFYEIVRDADTFDLLCAWKSLYETIDAIARKGWVHRDLSLANVRIRRTQDINGPPSTILIDFDLAARIEGDPSGSPDKTGTLLFMPVHILEHDPGVSPVHHQELHEDEAAFWVGFLGLIYRSETGHRYID